MSEAPGQKRKMEDKSVQRWAEEPRTKLPHDVASIPTFSFVPLATTHETSLNFGGYPDIIPMVVDNIPKYWSAALKLGSGAFGEVHLVHSDRLDERGQNMIHNEFVIKCVKLAPNRLRDIVREVKMHLKCRDHENVLFAGVTYFQAFTQGYRTQMCMEYAAMSDMSLLVAKEKKENHIAYVCREVIKALVYIHSKGVVHGDISYRNVLATHRGVIKLSDFGMADTLENTRVPGRDVHGGTPGFMAPEVIKKEGYDGKADLWGLGVLALSFIVCGNPFKQGYLFDLQTYTNMINEEYYPDIDKIEMSSDLREFLDDLKQYDPTERSHAHELTLDLFIVDSCSRREFQEHYHKLRVNNRVDFPYPDDTQGFTVPTTREV